MFTRLPIGKKVMNRKIKEFESVVSFRLSGDEKKKLGMSSSNH